LVTLVRPASGEAQTSDAAPSGVNPARFAQSAQYPLLPRALEVELALSAAPKHLRDTASVWVLESTGYALANKGTNAFTCIVSRRGGDLFPVCWDVEGASSLMRVDFDDAQLRLAGKSGPEIDAIVADRYKGAQYRPPARAGIAYMLSPMRYRIDERGAVTRTVSSPHLMFYGPNLTDGDIGGARGAFVFMNRVGPDGMMIVPVGQTERERILGESQALIARVEQAIGYQSSR
jgi:hypothetical protein